MFSSWFWQARLFSEALLLFHTIYNLQFKEQLKSTKNVPLQIDRKIERKTGKYWELHLRKKWNRKRRQQLSSVHLTDLANACISLLFRILRSLPKPFGWIGWAMRIVFFLLSSLFANFGWLDDITYCGCSGHSTRSRTHVHVYVENNWLNTIHISYLSAECRLFIVSYGDNSIYFFSFGVCKWWWTPFCIIKSVIIILINELQSDCYRSIQRNARDEREEKRRRNTRMRALQMMKTVAFEHFVSHFKRRSKTDLV